MNKTAIIPNSDKRSIRIFVSSTFQDMIEDRNELMTHAWPELRLFCRERQVELVEVDLRWGIAEAQSMRKETLKFCLDEIRACHPYFIGLLGEHYGWVPGEDAFTDDLREEQPWLNDLRGKSVTELEILHGVLNNPEMADRAFFYFRDPAYAREHGIDFLPKNDEAAKKQTALKNHIRKTCFEKNIPLYENYPNPEVLASLVLEKLQAAIEAQFPKESIPDPIDREARDHDAFAGTRRRTYIGRPDYFEALDKHASGEGAPLLLLGDSGSGKSSLLANWIDRYRKTHPEDIIFEHYIGGTPDSAVHWKLMTRLMAEIKRWTADQEDLPRSNEVILRDFPLWLIKARINAAHKGIRFIVVLDALNQLEDKDRGKLLGWLPGNPFSGPLRLIVSTLPGDTLDVIEKKDWLTLRIHPLTMDERRRMIVDYLARFSKMLDSHRLDRLSAEPSAANPLYLKILLDELRVTGTHDRLDERLNDYLEAKDIPSLLGKVITRYQSDYEHDHTGLVGDALGLICAARRGLSESELLQLLKPDHLPQLPLATWAPLRAAIEEGLVDRGGILNFAHDFLRKAVETAFLPDLDKKDDFQIKLADFFEAQPPDQRNCDELPWLLWKTESFERLRESLLDIDRFLFIYERDEDELRSYWVYLNEEKNIGNSYLLSFNGWLTHNAINKESISNASNTLALFMDHLAHYIEADNLYRFSLKMDEERLGEGHPDVAIRLINLATLLTTNNRHGEAEPLFRRALKINEESLGRDHPNVAACLNNLAVLLSLTNHQGEAELLMQRAIKIAEDNFGKDHPFVAKNLNNLSDLLHDTNRFGEAEPLMRRALKIDEDNFGKDHPNVARDLRILARLLFTTNRYNESELLMIRALKIDEDCFGLDHPNVAISLDNLAGLYIDINRYDEALPLINRAIKIDENIFGKDHPRVARDLDKLASLFRVTNRIGEAETAMRSALKINEDSYGKDHPDVARDLNNLALLLQDTNRSVEAENLFRRALKIDEDSYGKDHPIVARDLNNLSLLLRNTSRLDEAEPLMKKVIEINVNSFGEYHPFVAKSLNNYAQLLADTNHFGEAEPIFKKALTIYEECLGKDHIEVAVSLNNLASLFQATNRLLEAEPLMKRAIEIFKRSLGVDHPDVAISLNNLAQLYKSTYRLNDAETLFKQSLIILFNFTRSTGHYHPHINAAINNYMFLLKEMGKTQQQIITELRKIAPEFFK